MRKNPIQKIDDLEVYTLSYQLAITVHFLTSKFPKEEAYSLSDQLRRSSRSISANISEGFAKRFQGSYFRTHLIIALGSLEETRTWISFAKDFKYLQEEDFTLISQKYGELGRMLFSLIKNWKIL